jgi:hypothetical protein
MSKAELSYFVEGTNVLTIDGYKKIENIIERLNKCKLKKYICI